MQNTMHYVQSCSCGFEDACRFYHLFHLSAFCCRGPFLHFFFTSYHYIHYFPFILYSLSYFILLRNNCFQIIQQFRLRQQIKIQCAPFNKICTYTFQLHKYPCVPPRQTMIIYMAHKSHNPKFVSKMDATASEPLGQSYIIPFDKIYFTAHFS